MEATQIPTLPPPDLEKMWAYLQETDRILKESAEQHKEFERKMNETFEKSEREREKSNAEYNKKLGEYINLFGDVTEYELSPKMREKFTEFGFDFKKTSRKICSRDSANDIFFEIDAMLENGDTAMLVEIKTELTVERIKKHIIRLEKMRLNITPPGNKPREW